MRTEINLRKTDPEWARSIAAFSLAATPVWFEWLGWALILGALQFIETKTHSIGLRLILVLSNMLLGYYFAAFFLRYVFINIPFVRSARLAAIASGAIGLLLSVGSYFLFQSIVEKMVASGA